MSYSASFVDAFRLRGRYPAPIDVNSFERKLALAKAVKACPPGPILPRNPGPHVLPQCCLPMLRSRQRER
jgi:hypothetical protein